MTNMGIAFNISTFLICFSCIIYTLIQNRNDKMQKKLYLYMIIIIAFNAITEIISQFASMDNNHPQYLYYILYITKYLYFITHTAVLLLLGYYVLSVTGGLYKFNKLKNSLFLTPIIIIEIILLTNPFHHWCYQYNIETLEYSRSWGVTALYIVSAFYIIFFSINLFKSWKAMTQKRRYSFTYFLVIVITGLLIQAINITIRVELLAESLAFLGLLLTVEDEADMLTDSGMYNRKALNIELDNLLTNEIKFNVICIKINNIDIIKRSMGTTNSEFINIILFEELKKYVSKYKIYQASPETFVLLNTSYNNEKANELIKNIGKRFEIAFNYNDTNFFLDSTLMLANIPNDIDNTNKIFDMIDSILPQDHKKYLIGKDDLSYLLRRKAVEGAIQRCLDENRFEVVYQPTFDINENIIGAEALVRIHDKEIKNLYPDEFIPIAEQIGLIDKIDNFVLNKACKLMSSGLPQKYGVKSINVNLSVLHCTKTNFIEKTKEFFINNNYNKEYINFEITESIDSNIYDVMNFVINSLHENEFKIYMDDFGTGYSNVHSLFKMDFNVIKIDKSILWGAFESDLGMIILENNIRMLKQMNLKILVEGVETKEQFELLTKFKVDYLQGYYFSKALKEEDFITFIENRKR